MASALLMSPGGAAAIRAAGAGGKGDAVALLVLPGCITNGDHAGNEGRVREVGASRRVGRSVSSQPHMRRCIVDVAWSTSHWRWTSRILATHACTRCISGAALVLQSVHDCCRCEFGPSTLNP
eukprot:358261-Chlamydomonas_euryale.AAC.1